MEQTFKLTKQINHVALIMDGNGRWAKERGLKRTQGHEEGMKRIIPILKEAKRLQIHDITLFAFSCENWNRPKQEIDFLFSYINIFFKNYIKEAMNDGVRINVFGNYSSLPKNCVETLNKAIEKTKQNDQLNFNICLNYGSHQEILQATKQIAQDVTNKKITIEQINDNLFNSYLYTKNATPIDLLIRTSGEERLSNFMLYQLAYSEFIFTKTYWPDFTVDKFDECLKEYEGRNRRFGSIKEKED